MERPKMIRISTGRNTRMRRAEATRQGRAIAARAVPAWRTVQSRLVAAFGEARRQALGWDLRALSDLAVGMGQRS